MDPKSLRYAPTHEWANLDGDVCTVGITKFAVDQLTDVVYIELPDVGDHVFEKDGFGEIESVKAVSEIYAPAAGEVTAANPELANKPELLNSDPHGAGWLVKVKLANTSDLASLMDGAAYEAYIAQKGKEASA